MTDGSQFSIRRIGKKAPKSIPKISLDDIFVPLQFLLNLNDSPFLLIDLSSHLICAATESVANWLGLPADSLRDIPLHDIFPLATKEFPALIPTNNPKSKPKPSKQTLTVQHGSNNLVPVTVIYWLTTPRPGLHVLGLDLPSTKKSNQKNLAAASEETHHIGSTGYELTFIKILQQAFRDNDFQLGLQKILSFYAETAGLSIAAIYQLQLSESEKSGFSNYCLLAATGSSDMPTRSDGSIRLDASIGNEWLPPAIPDKDIKMLLPKGVSQAHSNSHLWTSGDQVQTDLHRTALEQGYSFVFINLIDDSPVVPIRTLPRKIRTSNYVLVSGSFSISPLNIIGQRSAECAAALQTFIQWEKLNVKLANISLETEKVQAIGELLQDHVAEGFLILDPSLKISRINQSAELILGYKEHEIKGHEMHSVLVGSESLWQAMQDLQTNHLPLQPCEVRLYRRSGDAFLATIYAHPVVIRDQLKLVLITIQDLTEEELARERNRQLEQRAILGEVTAVFAHEVRNPINNISTGLELISYNLPTDDPNQETLSRLLQDCDRLGELMRSVLSFARPIDFTLTSIPVEPFLEKILDHFKQKIDRLNITGSIKIEPGCPNILGSPRALEQVLINLINNAIQAMGETGGQLILRAELARQDKSDELVRSDGIIHIEPDSYLTNSNAKTTREYVELSVVDTGPGIPKEMLDHIFQPFFTTSKGGTGLGLAISKRIITAHRGNIQVESFPGGTVFHVLIPVATP